ncbi:MAG: hypothetical protein WC523_03145 [Patescibacteria group bacterium]|jgi:hypothetical protein
MTVQDKLYGKIEITEPVILELINSPELQRLKGVDQGGYTQPYHPLGQVFSRFDHSLGVYWLLKTYGAPLEEQIAGLIHDVSHSVFSHCIDYVLIGGDGGKQSHQDNIFESFVKKSSLPKIIEKYNLKTNYLLDDDHFLLKERELPELCADRLDYSLRTALIYQNISQTEAQEFLNNLVIKDNNWVLKNLEIAEKYAQLFLKLNHDYWASLTGATMHLTVGDYLRYALEKNYLQEADLYTTDNQILEKTLRFHQTDPELKLLFEKMENKIPVENKPQAGAREIKLKSRMVDPLFLDGSEIKRLSEVKTDWKKIVAAELEPKKYFLKFTC